MPVVQVYGFRHNEYEDYCEEHTAVTVPVPAMQAHDHDWEAIGDPSLSAAEQMWRCRVCGAEDNT